MGYYFFSGLLLIWYPPILRWQEPRKDAQKKVVHFPMKASGMTQSKMEQKHVSYEQPPITG